MVAREWLLETFPSITMETVSNVISILVIATVIIETITKVIHILAHSNQSLATVTMDQNINHLGNSFHDRILNQLDTLTNGN